MIANTTTNDSHLNISEATSLPSWEVLVFAFLALWTMLANTVLVLSQLLHPGRRLVPFNLHIANLGTVYLMVGVAVLPLLTSTYSYGAWQYGEDMCMFWIVCDGILVTTSVLAVLMLNVNRFLQAVGKTVGPSRYVVCAVMLGSSWLVALILVVSFILDGMDRRDVVYGTCALIMPEEPTVSYLLLTFFIPAVFVIALNAAVITLFFILPDVKCPAVNSEKHHAQTWQLVAVSLVSINAVLWSAPWAALSLMAAIDTEQAKTSREGRASHLTAAYLFSYLGPALHPVLWLVYPGVRRALRDLVCCHLQPDHSGSVYKAPRPRDEAAARMMPDPDQTHPLELHE